MAEVPWKVEWKLSCTQGADLDREFRLTSGEVVIGRDPGCSVRLSDELVARRHVSLKNDGDAWLVRDLGSGRSVMINGQSLRGEGRLESGDSLSLGGSRLVLLEGEQTVLNAPRATPEQTVTDPIGRGPEQPPTDPLVSRPRRAEIAALQTDPALVAELVRAPPTEIQVPDEEATVLEPARERKVAAPPSRRPLGSSADGPAGAPPSFVADRADVGISDESTQLQPKLRRDPERARPVRRRARAESQPRVKPALLFGAAALLVLLLPLIAVKVLRSTGAPEQSPEAAVQEAMDALRARRWEAAKAALEPFRSASPVPEGVAELFARAERELANEQALAKAARALELRRLTEAAQAIGAVSEDTQLREELRSARQRLEDAVSRTLSEARQAVREDDFERAIALTGEILGALPQHSDAAKLREQAVAAREQSTDP